MKKILMLMFLMVFTGIISACSSGTGPSKDAVDFYTAANDKNYEEAEKYVAQEVFDYAESRGYDIKDAIDPMTHDGDIKKVKAISEEINGEEATVVVELTFNSGGTQTKELPMYLEEETWKIGLEQ